ncbi:MAG: c-type cytochrome [Alphaproteobacteria bacterium]
MNTFLKVVTFSLLVVGFFAGYSRYGIPQIEPAPPPKVEELDLASMTMDQFVALGERIYNGRGTCTLCHSEVGARAPLLDDVVAVAEERLADEAYAGEAEDVAGYLYESMVDPSAYVVAGFGKAGTGDTESPMPSMQSGAIGLVEAEMLSVVAFLQDLSGAEVTVEVPSEGIEDLSEEEEEEDAEEDEREVFAALDDIISEFACGACHRIGEEEGEVGPDLTTIGAQRDRDYLRRAILLPNAEIAEGFEADMMPADYGEMLYAGELEMLIDYMVAAK